jgi:hypothetical protein
LLFFIVWSFISAPSPSHPDEKLAYLKSEESSSKPDSKSKEFLDFDDKENEILSQKETTPVSSTLKVEKAPPRRRENFLNGVRYKIKFVKPS